MGRRLDIDLFHRKRSPFPYKGKVRRVNPWRREQAPALRRVRCGWCTLCHAMGDTLDSARYDSEFFCCAATAHRGNLRTVEDDGPYRGAAGTVGIGHPRGASLRVSSAAECILGGGSKRPPYRGCAPNRCGARCGRGCGMSIIAENLNILSKKSASFHAI